MEVVLRKYGNSTVLALPPAVLKDLGLKAAQGVALVNKLRMLDLTARKAIKSNVCRKRLSTTPLGD